MLFVCWKELRVSLVRKGFPEGVETPICEALELNVVRHAYVRLTPGWRQIPTKRVVLAERNTSWFFAVVEVETGKQKMFFLLQLGVAKSPMVLRALLFQSFLSCSARWRLFCFVIGPPPTAPKLNLPPGSDPGFWSGGPSRVLTPRGDLSPKFAQNGFFQKKSMILKIF